MNWIEVTAQDQLPYDSLILAKNEYGDIGAVYWNAYDWLYLHPFIDCEEVRMPGKIVKYVLIEKLLV